LRWKEKLSATEQKESIEASMAKRQPEEKSRADKVRVRRQQSRKETRVNPFGNSASRKQAKNRPPVTRRHHSTTPIVSRKRRKVNVPLKSKGAELQLPAFPRLRLGWRLISGAVFLLSLFVVISFSGLSTFKVNAITLEGAQRLSQDAILSQMDMDLIGQPIAFVNPEEIRTRIEENFPGLSSVDVVVGLPASVTIQVVERHPLILWQLEQQSYWIDAEGVVFPLKGEAEAAITIYANSDPPAAQVAEDQETNSETGYAENPAVSSNSNPTAIVRTTPGFVQGILALREYVPQDSFLQYDPEYGLGWQDPRGWQIYFGKNTADIDLKLAEYETIITTLAEKNLIPSVISLEFLDAPFYRLE